MTTKKTKLYFWVEEKNLNTDDLIVAVNGDSSADVYCQETIDTLFDKVEENGDEPDDGTVFEVEVVSSGKVKTSYQFVPNSDC